MRALLTIVIAIAALTTGCAQEKSRVAQVPSGNPYPDCRGCLPDENDSGIPGAPGGTGEDPASTGFDSGSTAELKLNGGAATLARMFFQSNPNNPTNVRINIDIRRATSAVIVRFQDSGRVVNAHFGTVHPWSGIQNAKHNGWVNQDGKSVWKGFFQDAEGAIVIVLDRVLSQGDGQASEFVGGSIWFQNFNRYGWNNPLQGPEKMCWEIQSGPYDCRTFLVNDHVNMISSLYPNNYGRHRTTGYEKLGEFDGINANAAGF